VTTDGGAAQQAYVAGQARKLAEGESAEPGQYTFADHAAHVAGKVCVTCGREIETGQPARRRGESGWAHDICPPVLD
jgi:hypothetical protein